MWVNRSGVVWLSEQVIVFVMVDKNEKGYRRWNSLMNRFDYLCV